MLKEREQKNEKPMPNGNDEYTAQKCLDILREIKDAALLPSMNQESRRFASSM